jgi:transposase
MRRYDLDDRQWDLIKDLFPISKPRGRPRRDSREMVNACFWLLHTGAPWRDLPKETYGPWSTAYDHFRKWRLDGTWDRVLERLEIRLDRQGRIDWDLWLVDGTSIRASRAAAGAGKRGGPGNPPTMLWAAREAGTDPSSTWFLAATPLRSEPPSAPARRTTPPTSRRRSRG